MRAERQREGRLEIEMRDILMGPSSSILGALSREKSPNPFYRKNRPQGSSNFSKVTEHLLQNDFFLLDCKLLVLSQYAFVELAEKHFKIHVSKLER